MPYFLSYRAVSNFLTRQGSEESNWENWFLLLSMLCFPITVARDQMHDSRGEFWILGPY